MTAPLHLPLLILALIFLASFIDVSSAQLNEEERLQEYHARNYSWPLTETVPNTEGWRNLMTRRFRQVAAIRDTNKRYEGYLQLMTSAVTTPNFTETGWGLSRCSDDLLRALRQGVRDGLSTARSEGYVDVIDGDAPLFIDRSDLTERVLKEIQHLEEAWSGVSLVPFRAYGFRLYQNNSRLYMHTDKSETHIISAILHVDRSDDAEPWPIVIEDYQGNTNEVLLEPGDILFYESNKCFHGRPRAFRGTYYTSVFVHYYPTGWRDVDHGLEAHYAVPPVWDTPPPKDAVESLTMVGTSMLEPDCPDFWCDLDRAIQWKGPGEEGRVLTTNHHKYELTHTHEEL